MTPVGEEGAILTPDSLADIMSTRLLLSEVNRFIGDLDWHARMGKVSSCKADSDIPLRPPEVFFIPESYLR